MNTTTKTDKKILALLRAVRAASPYSSRKWQWEIGYNSHLENPFQIDEQLGGFDEFCRWSQVADLGIAVGTSVDFYVFENEGDVRNPDWTLHTNYVVTITSETTATIRDTGEPERQFSL